MLNTFYLGKVISQNKGACATYFESSKRISVISEKGDWNAAIEALNELHGAVSNGVRSGY